MDLNELIHEVGGDVFVKDAKVEVIERMAGVKNLKIQVRILNPSTVPVNRQDTWLAKLDEEGKVVCILHPTQFPIFAVTEFALRGTIIPGNKTTSADELIDAILNHIQVSDELKVLHIMPAKNPGRYCSFNESAPN
jgi:hypothetical protein